MAECPTGTRVCETRPFLLSSNTLSAKTPFEGLFPGTVRTYALTMPATFMADDHYTDVLVGIYAIEGQRPDSLSGPVTLLQ